VFRSTWAQFVDGRHVPRPAKVKVAALGLSRDAAERLCGTSVVEVAERMERQGKPERLDLGGRRVALAGATETAAVALDNVVGWIAGADPELADEVVVVGAHYDHLGVDARGRIAFGADDNASGTAVLIELAEALVAAGPRRSVALCAFAAEEDGLLGSYALLDRPPVAVERLVAMINMDMVGRGDAREVAVVGLRQNPDFERLLKRAQKEVASGVRKIVTKGGEELFKRTDHYPFHERGVPSVFFFEGLPISRNKDYHTWRDTIDQLDFDKIENTARLVFATTWLLANDDKRPAPPRD
jgi:Zn-dependent M28 family amino/carboxypeptidase